MRKILVSLAVLSSFSAVFSQTPLNKKIISRTGSTQNTFKEYEEEDHDHSYELNHSDWTYDEWEEYEKEHFEELAKEPKEFYNSDTVVLHSTVVPLEFHEETPNLRDVPTVDLSNPVEAKPRGERGWPKNEYTNVNALPQGLDPALQKVYPKPASSNKSAKAATYNWEGIGYTSVNPADPTLDVGPNHVVQMINGSGGTKVQVFDKTGSALTGVVNMSSLCGTTSGDGDPIVMYDQRADRWVLTEFLSSGNKLLVAVSKTADPTGAYYTYSLSSPGGFPDYPKYSIWEDSYICTANVGSSDIFAFDRTSMLTGGAANAQYFTQSNYGTISFQAATPVSLNGLTSPPTGAPAMVMRMRDDAWSGVSSDALEIWDLNIDWVTPSNSTFSQNTVLGIAPYDSDMCGYTTFNCIPQPGTSTKIDPLREVLMNRIHYRNFGSHESIVCCHVADVDGTDHAGVRWYELRRTGGTTGAWTIYQQGTYAPDSDNRFMASIGISASGNIGLMFNISSSSTYPSIRYTGRKECDPLNTMTEPETVIMAGSGSQGSGTGGRYGDYNSMGLDPVDGETFYCTAMYNPSGQWSTRNAAFKIATCVSNPPVCGITASTTTITEGSSVTFSDASTDNPTSWSWNFDNTSVGSTTPATSTSQNPGAVTFNSPGTYEVQLTASNSAGSCSTTVTITVNPNTTPPTCGINASATNIVEGNTVDFTDGSTGVPTSWSWNFDNTSVGSTTPGTSTSQNPGSVLFNTPGTYEVQLTATNAYGSCNTTVNIIVDPSSGCDTLTNILPTHNVTIYGSSNGGYVSGWNGYGDIAKAEYYSNYSPFTDVTGAQIGFYGVADGGNGTTVDLTIWDDNAGTPNAVVQTETFNLADIDAALTNGQGALFLSFSSPVNVAGNPFYVGLQFNNFQSGDSLGILSNTFGESTANTAWEQWSDNSWNDMASAWSSGTLSMWIDPFVTDRPVSVTASANLTTVCANSPIDFSGTGTNVTAYNWTFNGGTPATSTNQNETVTYSTPGNYTAYLLADGYCSGIAIDSVQFTVTDLPVPTASTTDPGCSGNDGQISISVTGGSGSATYSIDGGTTFQASNSFTGLSAGTYNIVVEDANGCQGTTSATLNPGAGTISHTSSFTDPLCNGDANGTITLLGSGGSGSYQYSIDGGTTFQANGNFSGLASGTYDIVVQDGGCQSTETISLTDPTSVLLSSSATSPSCSTGSGSITISGSGGAGSYQYSIDGGSTFQVNGNYTGLAAGTYNLVVQDANGCQATGSESIVIPTAISVGSSSTSPTCASGTGTITITASGGTGTLQYSIDGGSTFQASNTFSGVSAGTYSLVVQDANGCTTNGSETVTAPAAISITTNSTNATCGASDGTLTISATGGTGAYQYSIDGGSTFQGSGNFTGLAANTYNIVVKDANNCQQTSTGIVSNTAGPSISGVTTNDVNCNAGSDGDLTISATGTATLQYSIDGGTSFQTNSTFATLTAGTYNIVVEDGNGCQTTSSATINEPTANTFNTTTTSPSCVGASDGAITFSGATGPNPKRYSINGGTTFLNNSNFTGLAAGTYNVAYRDGNGCIVYGTTTITDPTAISISSSTTPATCGSTDGQITITATGGTGSLQYSIDGGSTFQANGTFTGLGSGAYSIVVQDANSCQQTASETITTSSGPSIAGVSTTDVTCNGGSDGTIDIAASGTATLQYSIDGGSSFQTTTLFSSLGASTYTVVVQDGIGCQSSTTATINEPSAISVSVTSTDENCGNSDGTITITASGGTGALQYSIDGGTTFQGTGSFSGLSTNSYNIVVKDASNCQTTSSVTVGVNNGPTISSVGSSDVTCFGGSNGSITLTAGGIATLQYSNDGGSTWQTSNTFSGLAAGPYNLYLQDGMGCTLNVGSLTLSEPSEITYTVSSTDATCGNSDGTLTLSGSGGTGSLQYSIDGGSTFQTSGSFTGLANGSYNVVIQDANSCQTTGVESVGTTSGPTITSSNSTDVSCNGGNDGTITMTVTGTPTLQYSIDGGTTFQSNNNFTGLSSGSYVIVAKDGFGCLSNSSSLIIGQPTAISYTANISNATCGGNDGSINLSGTGGTGSLQYSIDGGSTFQSSGNFTGLNSGAFNVVIQDANTCQTTGTESVGSTSGPSITNETANDASCNGASDGSITISATGTATLEYSIDGGSTFSTSNTFSGLSSGSYNIVVRDGNSCITNGTALTVNQPTAVSYTASISNATCGNNNGSISVTGSGGTGALQYSSDGGINFQSSGSFGGLAGGTYNIVVKDINGCQASGVETVGSSSAPTISAQTSTDLDCNGASNGTISITASGTGTLQYSVNGGISFQASNTFTGLGTGNYNIVVEDGNGCTVNGSSVTISEPSAILFSTSTMDASCGSSNGSMTISATGGTGNLQYSIDGGSTFQASGTFSGLATGSYNIVVQDDNNCQVSGSDNVGSTTGPTITNESKTNVTCNGADDGSILISATGSGTLSYSINGGSTFSSSGVFTGLPGGTYNVVVKDGNGCIVNGSTFNVVEPSVITVSVSSVDATCGVNDGGINITASGGTGTLQYSIDGGNTFQASSSFNGVGAGTYNVVVRDGNSCTGTGTANVNSVPGPSITSSASTDITCYGDANGSITIVGSGNSPISYSIDGGSTYQTSGNFSGLAGGTYIINVMDVNGCTTNSSALTVTEPSAIAISSSTTNATCGNSDGAISLTATGGTGSIQYSIDNGSTFQSSGTFGSISAGSYDIVVEDANSCQSTSNITIVNTDGPMISNIIVNDETCFGTNDGSVEVVATGNTPLTYSFANGPYTVASSYGGATGLIDISVKDANGCVFTTSATITAATDIQLSSSTQDATCGQDNGSATVIATGGTGTYTYEWDDASAQTNNVAINLGAGSYELLVTDSNGCQDSTTVAINSGSTMTVNVEVTHESCPDEEDGSIATTVSGGQPPYAYSWSNGDSTAMIENLAVGDYILEVSDADACIVTLIIPIENEGGDCIEIPTAISPNADGANDTWIISGLQDYPDAVIEIYNRWGSLLYSSNNYQNDWDGTYDGENVPAGVYYYVIKINDDKTYTGSLTVIR